MADPEDFSIERDITPLRGDYFGARADRRFQQQMLGEEIQRSEVTRGLLDAERMSGLIERNKVDLQVTRMQMRRERENNEKMTEAMSLLDGINRTEAPSHLKQQAVAQVATQFPGLAGDRRFQGAANIMLSALQGSQAEEEKARRQNEEKRMAALRNAEAFAQAGDYEAIKKIGETYPDLDLSGAVNLFIQVKDAQERFNTSSGKEALRQLEQSNEVLRTRAGEIDQIRVVPREDEEGLMAGGLTRMNPWDAEGVDRLRTAVEEAVADPNIPLTKGTASQWLSQAEQAKSLGDPGNWSELRSRLAALYRESGRPTPMVASPGGAPVNRALE